MKNPHFDWKAHYRDFLNKIDIASLRGHAVELCRIEMGQTIRHQKQAAQYAFDLIRENGIPNAEMISFPADGKTVYQDKRMPLAWDATCGKLTQLLPGGAERVLADYQQHPFHLIHGSVATPEEGIITKIITEDQYLAGTDPRGCLVMLNPMTDPRPRVLKPLLDQGALGLVSDYLKGRYSTPDSLQWVVACTEGGDWHITEEDRPFIGFSVSPRTGDMIRTAANHGTVKVRVQCDGRRFADTLPAVTALIPGKDQREVWILAHLYEPMINDDALGVVTAIEVARRIMEKNPVPDHSIRLVFAAEFYGFAAYAASRGGDLTDQVIGGCNLDSMCAVPGREDLKLCPSGCSPSIMNELLKEAYEVFKDERKLNYVTPEYHDDMFLSDRNTGLPTIWLMHHHNAECWHNSAQCDPDYFDWQLYRENTAFACAYLYRAANCGDMQVPARELKLEKISSPWRDYAAKFIFARKEKGTPYSLAKVPRHARIKLPDGMIYGHFANVLSNMDGVKDTARLFLEAEAEREKRLSEQEIKKDLDALNFLADYGYLTAVQRPEIRKEDICRALKDAGITQNDVLLVHASVSGCGYISGGAKTMIDAIRESTDTCLFTTFTRPYIYLGGVNTDWAYAPYDPAEPDQVWTGETGKTVLRQYPDAVRSRHVTHSWAGFGSRIRECLAAHGEFDSPCGKDSPPAKAWQLNGKVLFFGCGPGSNTFLHFLEDSCDLPFLDTAVCRVKNADGSLQTVAIPKHLPGDRDFYHATGKGSGKFYDRAFARGLKKKSVPLGMGELIVFDLADLYEIGMTLIKEDPDVLLCDRPDCLFCRDHKTQKA